MPGYPSETIESNYREKNSKAGQSDKPMRPTQISACKDITYSFVERLGRLKRQLQSLNDTLFGESPEIAGTATERGQDCRGPGDINNLKDGLDCISAELNQLEDQFQRLQDGVS
jgi:hypothetical protein